MVKKNSPKKHLFNISNALNIKKKISNNTILESLAEWDSVGALNIIGMVDKIYKKTISGDQLVKCKTVGDLINLFK